MDEEADMHIFQIVGYKNSGKTTVTEALIADLTGQGYHVATLKHHGHGGNPDSHAGTDSDRHYRAGAVISGVQGESELQLTLEATGDSTQQIIQLIRKMAPHDILLLEGYKSLSYPKIVLLRNEDDLNLLQRVDNIVAVGCHSHRLQTDSNVKTFLLDDFESTIPKIAAHMLDQVYE